MDYLFSYLQGQPFGAWAYLLIFALVAFEGPIVTLAGAAASSAGFLNPLLVFLSAAFGNLAADVVWYRLGYLGKKEWLIHYGRWFGLREKSIHRLQSDMENHIGKILFTAKLTLGLVIPTLVATGLARIPWRRWFGVLFLAECMWTGFLVIVGHYFGRYVQTLERDLKWVSLVGAALFVVLIFVFLARRRAAEEITG
ncbi:MAG TPA: VTT domain-containing protein, partial [Anaerolineales bacterium]